MFNYYENGKVETLSARKVYRLYTIAVDDEQTAQPFIHGSMKWKKCRFSIECSQ